jgi:hypothetical protein
LLREVIRYAIPVTRTSIQIPAALGTVTTIENAERRSYITAETSRVQMA